MQYLKLTRSLKPRIQVEDPRVMKCYINVAHVVHWDFMGKTGAGMTWETGIVLF
jgi:hypothetical protein